MCIGGSVLCPLGQAGREAGNLPPPSVPILFGAADGSKDNTSLIIPFGVMLAVMTLAVMALLLYLVNRRQNRHGAQLAAAAAAGDEEEGGRCSLDSDCPPCLPKLPVIIIGPDGSKGMHMSFGWELQHTPCGSPTCAAASSSSCASLKDSEDGKLGGQQPAASPRAGEAAAGGTGDDGVAAPPPAVPAAFSSRRRPPLISIELLSPDAVPATQQAQQAQQPAQQQPAPEATSLTVAHMQDLPSHPQAAALQCALPARTGNAAAATRC